MNYPPPPQEVQQEEQAEPPKPRGPFSRGSMRLTLLLGTGTSTTDTYLILGAGVGYFIVDGLAPGVDYEAWIFGSPVLQRLTPELRYVLHFVPVVKPYVAAFYRHTFVTDYDDWESVGGKAGIYYAPPNGRLFMGLGAVYERLLDCTSSAFVDCDNIYPEVTIGIAL